MKCWFCEAEEGKGLIVFQDVWKCLVCGEGSTPSDFRKHHPKNPHFAGKLDKETK